MKSVNKVILVGNVANDVYYAEDANKNPRATFSLATNREWQSNLGEKKQSTEFHNVCCWGALAELVNSYVKKGHPIYIEGFLKTRSTEKNGTKQFRCEIVVENLIMLNQREVKNDPIGNPAAELARV